MPIVLEFYNAFEFPEQEPNHCALEHRAGLFVESLIKHLPTPNLDIELVLRKVGMEVFKNSNGKQKPVCTACLHDSRRRPLVPHQHFVLCARACVCVTVSQEWHPWSQHECVLIVGSLHCHWLSSFESGSGIIRCEQLIVLD